ncbi:MAG: carboxymuconolactone decarboxylase family protein [Candidatus Accumulibacter sp.]|jgi:alkylhydroperoxidase/carboxymuconolactone decarboxylase family protein YurZ|nr:carboxymuconolactone decarboxylase family protein [Accumulibacter sp.]
MTPHWAAMREFDEPLYEKCTAWRDALTYHEVIPLRQKEMMMIAMACLIRFESGIRTHVRYALAEGVSREEIFASAALAMLLGGIPAYRDGIIAIKDEFERIDEEMMGNKTGGK